MTKFLKIPPWAGVSAAAWSRASEALVFNDMRCCRPAIALADRLTKGAWKVIPYETEDLAGNLVWASNDAGARPLLLKLGISGWHALFVGLYATNATPSHAWLKLDGDQAPTPVVSEKGPAACENEHGYWWIQEIFWKVAELKREQRLHIRQVASGFIPTPGSAGCGLAYVKAIPLTRAEIAGLRADRGDPEHRRVAVTCDHLSFMHGIFPCKNRAMLREAILAELEIFRSTDVATLLLHIGGADQVCYPTRFGTMIGQAQDSFADPGQRRLAEAVRESARHKINPTRILIEGAHDIGLKVHVGLRPALWSYYEPFTDLFQSDFFKRHPEWRMKDRDGSHVARMSWAVPEVRRHLLAVLGEAVSFGADGAHLVFNRGFPVTLYEPAFRALFRKRHGADPRRLGDSDPRVVAIRSDIVAGFLRDLRTALDDEERRRGNGRRLTISLATLGCEADNLQYGLDLRRLARERLVDEVYPSMHAGDFGATTAVWDMDFFIETCTPNGVAVIPMISFGAVGAPGYYPYPAFIRMGLDSYAKGAAGMAFWDPNVRNAYDEAPHEYWQIASRFGHRLELKARARLQPSRPVYRRIRRLGEHRMDARFPIFWGG